MMSPEKDPCYPLEMIPMTMISTDTPESDSQGNRAVISLLQPYITGIAGQPGTGEDSPSVALELYDRVRMKNHPADL